jgi:hypothetical protein
VIDAATVDGRRRLVLIRRDNVEHLLMIGGPTDVVVEPNIVRAAPAREATRAGIEPGLRQPPVVENAWPLQPANEPTPAIAPRSFRAPAATEEPWHAPEPGARPRPAEPPAAALAPEMPARHGPPEVAPPVTARQEPVASPQTDHNLAEMAQQLEAALRRTAVPDSRPPVTDALAQPKPAARPPREFKLRVDPRIQSGEPKIEPKAEPKVEPKFETAAAEPAFDLKPEPKFDITPEPAPEAKPEPGKKLYDNLEEEMANLLGRPASKT